jgi:toxin-antitoxin system PIN domain toxin
MNYLLDTNTALAILHGNHENHGLAMKWLSTVSEPGSIGLCRVAEVGMFRVLTQRSVMGANTVSPIEAWNAVERMYEDDRFVPAAEPYSLPRTWRDLISGLHSNAMADTDTYLAAFAKAAGLQLVTFDTGYQRFPDVKSLILR